MSATIEQASKKAGDVEQKLKAGKPFLAGDEPGPQDAQAFQELFGSNMHVARWAKHMASFTALERASWKATAPQTQVRSSFSSEAAAEKPAGKPAAAPAAKAEKPAIEPERTEKRDFLRDLETRVQARWEAEKVFEVDPPGPGEEDNGKFLATFPYPYMNGKLHLGHCFSVLKAEFAVAYQRLQGKRALFPFGLHCTGMPIQAAAYKLRSDYEAFGSPYPVFPCGKPQVAMVSESEVDVAFMPPTSTAHDMITGFKIEQKIDQGEWTPISVHLKNKSEKTESDVTLPMQAGPSKALNFSVEGLPTGSEVSFRVTANLEGDRKTTPTGASSDPVALKAKKPEVEGKAKDAGKKKPAAKIVAKTGSALRQWDIMIGMGLSEEEIPAFVDPSKWLDYFPPLGRDDLKMLGVHADFRRTFITTPANPYYDAFVRWQFNKLRAGNYLAFGKRPTVYSEIDQQACMDHDRAEGEGVGHTEYTAIKVKLVEPYPKAVENLKATGKPVYLLCATLRPETMIGQTNCWILPEGKYGVFERNNELVVCSERSARNMSFQDLFPAWGKPVKVQDVTGAELMGASLAAPRAPYKIIHLLPLLTIKMNKGTGIVTSVPADSPDDYAAFKELKNEKKREFYGVKAEWVEPFNVVPIIDVKIDGENRSCSAEYMCEKLGVQSQKDAEKLRQAHDVCYTLGFYEGVMSTGDFKGVPVQKAKLDARSAMVAAGEAFTYHEPESLIMSRSGDECVIALIDQWYLKYGEKEWKAKVLQHVEERLDCYTPACKKAFTDVLAWLQEWACSRSFGLGTKIPWDQQFVIESLSDSTIYMAYYMLAKFFHGHDNLKGAKMGPGGIKAEDLTDECFDYILLKAAYKPGCPVPEEKLAPIRAEFEYFYPVDLRVSGKDLIQNHLTMSLYNHAAIWPDRPEMWPKSFYTNGWVLVDGEKMSKSKGNFFTLSQAVETYSADALRLACAYAGDSMEDANFEVQVAKKASVKINALFDFVEKALKEAPRHRTGAAETFMDRWFANEMGRLANEAGEHFERMRFKEAVRCSWFDFHAARDTYLDVQSSLGSEPHHGLLLQWIEWVAIMMSIITPHASEHIWSTIGKEGTVLDTRFPKSPAHDGHLVDQGKYLLETVKSDLIEKYEKAKKKAPKQVNIYVAVRYPDWKLKVIGMLKEQMKPDNTFPPTVMKIFDKKSLPADDILVAKGAQVGKFAGMIKSQAEAKGPSAFDLQLPYEEMPLLREHEKYLLSKVPLQEMHFYIAADENVPEQTTAENAVPGRPSMAFP